MVFREIDRSKIKGDKMTFIPVNNYPASFLAVDFFYKPTITDYLKYHPSGDCDETYQSKIKADY